MPHDPGSFRHQQGVDTLGAVARDLASPVAIMYRALVEQGVPERAARHLAGVWLRSMVRHLGEQRDG